MIKPGIQLCNGCGRTSTGFYYRSGTDAEHIAKLTWSVENKSFCLVSAKEKKPSIFFLKDADAITSENFPPQVVTARIGAEPDYVQMKRCCPHCGKPFDSDLIGLVHSYVIAVMGAQSAGKTSWLGALATAALGPLEHQHYPYALLPDKYTAPLDTIGATLIGVSENDNTNYFKIIHRESGEIVALVYLLDYGGELYAKQKIDADTPVSKLLRGNSGEGYPGIDALVVIEPAVSTVATKSKSAELVPSISKIKGIHRKDLPIAHILTFADKLLEQEAARSPVDPEPPLLTAKTFPATAYTNETAQALSRHFTPEAIADRFHIQNHIAGKCMGDKFLGSHLMSHHCDQTRHFLVQSCVCANDTTSNNDYSKQFNVVDPLIWILHELKLLPLVPKNGG